MTLDKPDRARQVEKSFSKTHANLSACTPGRTRFHGWQFRWGGQEAQGSESEEEHDLQVLNRCFTVLASDNTSRLASPCRGDFSSPSQTIKFKQNSGVTTERREELLQRPLSSRPQGPCRASAVTLCPLSVLCISPGNSRSLLLSTSLCLLAYRICSWFVVQVRDPSQISQIIAFLKGASLPSMQGSL